MDSGLAAILGASVGAAGASVAQLVASIRQATQRKEDRRLELMENALNGAVRERRLLRSQLSLWHGGLVAEDPRVGALDGQVAEAIEAVWIAENSLLMHFGSGSDVVEAFGAILVSLDALKSLIRRAPGPPNQADLDAWAAETSVAVRSQRAFADIARRVARLE